MFCARETGQLHSPRTATGRNINAGNRKILCFFDSEEQAKTASLIIRDLCENRSSDPDGKFVKE